MPHLISTEQPLSVGAFPRHYYQAVQLQGSARTRSGSVGPCWGHVHRTYRGAARGPVRGGPYPEYGDRACQRERHRGAARRHDRREEHSGRGRDLYGPATSGRVLDCPAHVTIPPAPWWCASRSPRRDPRLLPHPLSRITCDARVGVVAQPIKSILFMRRTSPLATVPGAPEDCVGAFF